MVCGRNLSASLVSGFQHGVPAEGGKKQANLSAFPIGVRAVIFASAVDA
jgi:hypothetical protein